MNAQRLPQIQLPPTPAKTGKLLRFRPKFDSIDAELAYDKAIIDRYCDKYKWRYYTDVIDKLINNGSISRNYNQYLLIKQYNNGVPVPFEYLQNNHVVIIDGIAQPRTRLTDLQGYIVVKHDDWQDYPQLDDFYKCLPNKPYASNAKNYSKIYGKTQAIRQRYIQPNHPAFLKYICFDVDTPDAVNAWKRAGLPPPQIIVINPNSDHAHYFYRIRTPLYMIGDGKHQHPIDYADAIECAFRERLQADDGFSGYKVQNPINPHWDTVLPETAPDNYSLGELASYVTLTTKTQRQQAKQPKQTPQPTPKPQGYIGRNVAMFNYLRKIAYRISRKHSFNSLLNELLTLAHDWNGSFQTPLDDKEIYGICKSISRYCTGEKFGGNGMLEIAQIRFSNHQRNRVNLRWVGYSDKQQQALAMLDNGEKQKVICQKLGIDAKTLYRWKNSKK